MVAAAPTPLKNEGTPRLLKEQKARKIPETKFRAEQSISNSTDIDGYSKETLMSLAIKSNNIEIIKFVHALK